MHAKCFCHTIKGVQKFNLNTFSSKDMYMYSSQPTPSLPTPTSTPPHFMQIQSHHTLKGNSFVSKQPGALAAKWLAAWLHGWLSIKGATKCCCFLFYYTLLTHSKLLQRKKEELGFSTAAYFWTRESSCSSLQREGSMPHTVVDGYHRDTQIVPLARALLPLLVAKEIRLGTWSENCVKKLYYIVVVVIWRLELTTICTTIQ